MSLASRVQAALHKGVSHLYDNNSPDGAWRDFRTEVGVASSWTTGYVLAALGETRFTGDTPERQANRSKAASNLADAFVSGEGWGYNGDVRTDADSTSWSLMGLTACGITVTDHMTRSLRRFAGQGGGFRTFLESGEGTHWQDEHQDVTAAALQAMLSSRRSGEERDGADEPIRKATESLLRGRMLDGSWNSYWYETPAYGTLHAVIALRAAGCYLTCPSSLLARLAKSVRSSSSSFHTALVVEILALHGRTDCVDALLEQQAVDGRWMSPSFLRVTKSSVAAPWLCPDEAGPLYADQWSTFSTATAVRSLASALRAIEATSIRRGPNTPTCAPTIVEDAHRDAEEDVHATAASASSSWPVTAATRLRQESRMIEMERSWPVTGSLRLGPPNSIFNHYPRLFLPYFEHIDEHEVATLSDACRLLAGAVVAGDRLVDDEVGRSEAMRTLFNCQALQFEAERLLGQVFPAESPIWNFLKGSLSNAMAAALEQDRFMAGRKPLDTLSVTTAEKMAVAKTAVAGVAIEGLRLITGTPPNLALLKSVDAYNLARQLQDDLMDWREDFTAKRPSTLMARLATLQPGLFDADASSGSRKAGIAIYYRKVAESHLTRACECLDEARELSMSQALGSTAPEAPWITTIDLLKEKIVSLKNDLGRIASRNLARASMAPKAHQTANTA